MILDDTTPYPEFINRLNETFIKGRLSNSYCCYCEVRILASEKTREHIVPRSKGGLTTLTCCKKCNNARGNRPLMEFAISSFVLKHPYAAVMVRNIKKLKLKYPNA